MLTLRVGILLIGTLGISTASAKLRPVTVCEVLEHLDFYNDKMIAVVGRFSSNAFDGAWLSEGVCDAKVRPRDSNWPYAIFIGCFNGKEPPRVHVLQVDRDALQAKLSKLRRTTSLGYYHPLILPKPGLEGNATEETQAAGKQVKEHWAVIYGRVSSAPAGGFGAVRAAAEICAPQNTWLEIQDSN